MVQIRAQQVSIIRNVWMNNFEQEFDALLSTVYGSGPGVIMGFDVEFPGFFREEALWCNDHEIQYQSLRANVDLLMPIQIGVAVAGMDGTILSAWNFNLKFDVDNDLHTESALSFLRTAGLNFEHHACFGIDSSLFGRKLAGSRLVSRHDRVPQWVTLSGQYDFGYLVKLLTGQQLPPDNDAFQNMLGVLCPCRFELRDRCPYGSLDTLAFQNGVVRRGAAHTAGSDALTTLELYLALVHVPLRTSISHPPGLSMPTPPGLSLLDPPCLFAPAEKSCSCCIHERDAFANGAPAFASAVDAEFGPDSWRSASCCKASVWTCPFADTSGNSWRDHARRAMASGTARSIQIPLSCRMAIHGASHYRHCVGHIAPVV